MAHSHNSSNHQEKHWCSDRRREVSEYVSGVGLAHGSIGEVPAWYIYPYISMWAVESAKRPGWVGWWVICGDCPTDHVVCAQDNTPRAALRDIAARWQSLATALAKGEQHPELSIGDPASAAEIAPQLAARAGTLAKIAEDESVWVQ